MDSNSRFRGGTWHRYKLGQAQFTKWLKQTADKVTPSANTAPGNGAGTETPTSIKKSQKKVAKAGVDGDVAVHWRELEIMASSVVDNAQPEDIPAAPINILRDVIGLRKKSARFFRRSAGDNDDDAREKNATHEHIIQVLERVLAKFEAVRARVQRTGRDAARSDSGLGVDVNDLNNMFEHLEVQASLEAADDEADLADIENQPETSSSREQAGKNKKRGKKKLQKGGGKVNKQRGSASSTMANSAGTDSSWVDDIDFGLEGEEEDEEFDYFMIIYCFFEDFNLIRSYICERWCDYYFDRSVDLNTLAVITNAAFELFHQMEHDLMMDMRRIGIRDRRMGQYEVMMMSIFAEFGMEHVEYEAYDNLTQEESDERIYKDEWDWLASPAFSTIRDLLRFIPPGKTAMMRKSDRTLPVYGATTANELSEFKDAVISDLLFDVVCVKALKQNGGAADILPAESELLLGFQDALRNNECSSAFIFSVQLYVDIRYILEDTVVHSFEQLQTTAHRIERRLPRQIEWASGPRRELRKSLRQRQRELERFMLNDVVLEDKLPRYLNSGLDREDVEDFYLLKHEPVWAGLLDFRAKLSINELGHELVHRSLIVEAAAYLYVAARAASRRFSDHREDFPAWADMDKFLASYADDSALKRGLLDAGDDPVAILKAFAAIAPASPADPEPQHVSLDAAPGQTDAFRQAVRIRQHLSRRYTTEDRSSQFFLQYMAGLIRQRLEPEMERLEAGAEADVSAVLRGISSSKPSAQPHVSDTLSEERKALAEQRVGLREKQRAARRKALLAQLSPIQQIQILEDTVNAQLEGLLSIDFMNLFYISKTVLCAVNDNQRVSLGEESGFKKDMQFVPPDQLVEVPLLLGDFLVGDTSKDEKPLWNMVKTVKAIVAKGGDELLDGSFGE